MFKINNKDFIITSRPSRNNTTEEPPPLSEDEATESTSGTTEVLADTGCTDLLIRTSDAAILHTVTRGGGLKVQLPNKEYIYSTGTGLLNTLPHLPPVTAHIFDDEVLSRSLLGIADLCNMGCTAIFTATGATIKHGNTTVMTGTKQPHEKLWNLTLQPFTANNSTHHTCNNDEADTCVIANSAVRFHYQHPNEAANVIRHENNAERVLFHHAALGSPTVRTFIRAIQRGWINIDGLTADMVKANMPHTPATAAGHLDLQRQGTRSTTTKPAPRVLRTKSPTTEDQEDDLTPDPTDDIMTTKVIDTSSTTYSDLTGRHPVQSALGNSYTLVTTFNNFIHEEPTRSKSADDQTEAIRRTLDLFEKYGHHPKLHRMDNEVSDKLLHLLAHRGIRHQLVAPSVHRQNKTERAIRDCKNHHIAVEATADPAFPRNQWCRTIPSNCVTLNLLRPWGPDKSKSAFEGFYGHKWDFNAHPLAPVGTKVTVYETPSVRGSWAPHGRPGFYIGPAPHHYRCFTCYVPSTHGTRVSDTLEWFPQPIHMPGSRSIELLTAAVEDLAHALTLVGNPDDAAPGPELRQNATDALRKMAAHYHPTPAHNTTQIIDEEPPQPLRRSQRVTGAAPAAAPTGAPTAIAETAPAAAPRAAPVEAPAAAPTAPKTAQTPAPRRSRRQATLAAAAAGYPKAQSVRRNKRVLKKPSPITKDDNINRTHAEHEAITGTSAVPTTYTVPLPPPGEGERRARATELLKMAIDVTRPEDMSDTEARTLLKTMGSKIMTNFAGQAAGPETLAKFAAADSKELRKLLTDTKSMHIIPRTAIPTGRAISYYNPQRREKIQINKDTLRTRGTYGGNISDYVGDVMAYTADLTTCKMLLNAAISEGAHLLTADISDFYLGTKLDTPEYMSIKRKQVPDDIMREYGLTEKSFDANHCIYVEVVNSIYGLPQAGKVAQDALLKHLKDHGYHQAPNTPCLFRHRSKQTAFTLIVDDFLIKYQNRSEAEHLLDTLRKKYRITVDWEARKYNGINIDFNREARTCTLSCPGYVQQALQDLKFKPAPHPCHSASVYTPPRYGSKEQQMVPDDTSAPCTPEQSKLIERTVGKFLWYSRAVDSTLQHGINKIGSAQATPTQDVWRATQRFLQHAHTVPDAQLVYHASDMILHSQSDLGYLTETNARSRVGGHHYLGNKTTSANSHIKIVNGPIETICTILGPVVASAGEGEYGAAFINAQCVVGLRNTLADLGYPQPTTTIEVDNKCAVGLANRTIRQKKSKTVDMRFHWIRDRIDQGQIKVIWRRGRTNLADYFTKSHPVHHVRAMRKFFVHDNPRANDTLERVC